MKERGAAAVEFAMVAMLLVTLLFGIAEAGWALFTQGTLAGAAREGARYYALHPKDADVVTETEKRVQRTAVLLDTTKITVEPKAENCPMPPPATNESVVTVTVRYTYRGLTGFFPAWTEFVMTAEGSMRCTG